MGNARRFLWNIAMGDVDKLMPQQSRKQGDYTQLGVRKWQIYMQSRNESTLAFVLHVLMM